MSTFDEGPPGSDAALDSHPQKLLHWLEHPQEMGAADYPHLCRLLDALVESRLGFGGAETDLDLRRQRMMALVFQVASRIDLPTSAEQELLARAASWCGVQRERSTSSSTETARGNLLEADAVRDLRDLWARLIPPVWHRLKDKPEAVLRRVEDNGWDAPLYTGEPYRNAQLIVLGELFLQKSLRFPERLREALLEALADELHPIALAEWADSTAREAALRDYISRTGLPPPAPRAPTRERVAESPSLAQLGERLAWCLANPRKMDDADYPRFCRRVDSLIESGLGFDPDDTYIDITRQRLMSVVFYLAYHLKLPLPMAKTMLTQARQFVWPGIVE